MGSAQGISTEKLLAVTEPAFRGEAVGDRFDEREQLAVEYADAMTLSDRDVDDELFTRLQAVFDPATLVELTATIAWENASSKFNRALRVPSQGLWRRGAA